jgi:hypothetical protein
MRIKSEQDILKLEVRRAIIEEIKGSENQARKHEAYKRYLCYKDKTQDFVVEPLLRQFDQSTVEEMQYCVANVSFVRKIIDKLARVYNNGVKREIVFDEPATENLHQLEKELDFNTYIRQANKFLKLQKNLAFYVKPCPVSQANGGERYTIKLDALNPYLYDVVEDYYDRTSPMAYILSDFDYAPTLYTTKDPAYAGRAGSEIKGVNPQTNRKDDIIADDPDDAKTKAFIWWTNQYHFTTDETGQIISGEEILNPIGELPFQNFALDQDGQFWARGGQDLIDGSILLNSVMTHNQHVAVTQGYGQFYMRGKNLPRNIKVGPSKAILMEYQEGEPVPELGFATASPQIDALRGLVESYIALLLTTNNLSTSSVSSSLNGQAAAPSGIAMVIDKAESMEDVNDQRQIFIDNEPAIWRKINKWLAVYGDAMVDGLRGLSLPENFEDGFVIHFNEAPVILSEAEKLANLKARKELGLDTMIDLVMKDNPSFSYEQAEEKLKQILEEKIKMAMDSEEESPAQEAKEEDKAEDEAEGENEDDQSGSNADENSLDA